jgi:hypothetical protein
MSTSDYRDAAVQFLLKPENLEVALEVAELVEDVKDKLVLEFWHTLKSKVCENQGKLPTWSVKLDSDEDLLKGGYRGLRCVPDTASKAQHYLGFRITQGGGTIYQGVRWNEEMKTPFDELSKKVPQVTAIRNRLLELSKEYAKPDTWFIGYKYLNNKRVLREKMSLLHIRGGGLATDVADEFLFLVEKMRELVEEANSRLQAIP